MPAKLFGTKHTVSWCLFRVSTDSWPVFCHEYSRWLTTVHFACFFGRCPFCLFIINFLSGIFFLAFVLSFHFWSSERGGVTQDWARSPPPPPGGGGGGGGGGKHENEVDRFVVKVFSLFYTQFQLFSNKYSSFWAIKLSNRARVDG